MTKNVISTKLRRLVMFIRIALCKFRYPVFTLTKNFQLIRQLFSLLPSKRTVELGFTYSQIQRCPKTHSPKLEYFGLLPCCSSTLNCFSVFGCLLPWNRSRPVSKTYCRMWYKIFNKTVHQHKMSIVSVPEECKQIAHSETSFEFRHH